MFLLFENEESDVIDCVQEQQSSLRVEIKEALHSLTMEQLKKVREVVSSMRGYDENHQV